MSDTPKLDAAKRPNGLRAMADGMIYLAGQTGVETANVWKTVDILRAAADEMERLKRERDEVREALQSVMDWNPKPEPTDRPQTVARFEADMEKARKVLEETQ